MHDLSYGISPLTFRTTLALTLVVLSYEVDMTAAFGTCKCGKPKAAHSSVRSFECGNVHVCVGGDMCASGGASTVFESVPTAPLTSVRLPRLPSGAEQKHLAEALKQEQEQRAGGHVMRAWHRAGMVWKQICLCVYQLLIVERMAHRAFIVACARTAAGKNKGRISHVHPAELGAAVVNSLILDRVPGRFDPALVDDVIFGCVSQVGSQSCNIGASQQFRRRGHIQCFV